MSDVQLSAQNSLTVKRLRNGDSLYVSLELNGIPLYQGVDPVVGTVSPDWTVAANQPVITPKITSMRGNAVTVSNHAWKYVGVELQFTGSESSGWKQDSTGKFAINYSTGALKIVDNLASKTNVANDTLEYSCVATVAGVEYSVAKTIDVMIQNIGASSYMGLITASTGQLTEDVQTATLTTSLLLAGKEVTGYYVKWYKDDEEWTDKAGSKSITVTRSDVDGSQLFIAEFYESQSDTTPVYRAGFNIIDTLDNYVVILSITSTNKEVDDGQPVTVGAKLVNTRTNAVESPTSATWKMQVMDKDSWKVLKSASTNSISVTTTETDVDGSQKDVEVLAEVSWNN